MSNNKTVGIYTLGCRVNQYESCAIAELLKARGYTVKKQGECDYYIVNTCAVTAESERKSRQLVRRFAKKSKVLVIGCASQIDNSYNDIPNVIYVGGNVNKTAVVDVITKDKDYDKYSVLDIQNAVYEPMNLSMKDELFSECRAFIKIQDGCNGKCTYCIIPKCAPITPPVWNVFTPITAPCSPSMHRQPLRQPCPGGNALTCPTAL